MVNGKQSFQKTLVLMTFIIAIVILSLSNRIDSRTVENLFSAIMGGFAVTLFKEWR